MWFKTRVSLVSIVDPVEILVAENLPLGTWYLHARTKTGPEMTSRGLLGNKATVFNTSSYLAFFKDGPGVADAIGACMTRIEEAIRAKADLCDLSLEGDPKAWAVGWEKINWPGAPPERGR